MQIQKKSERITILGDGAWGTAVAHCLAMNGYDVTLWCHNADVAESIMHKHINTRYLPDIHLSTSITATTDLKAALVADIIFEAIPVQFLRSILEQAGPFTRPEQTWVILSKGLEQHTFLLPSQILAVTLGIQKCVVMAGPSYARELAVQQPTAFTLAADHVQDAHAVGNLFAHCPYVRTQVSSDLLGAQVVGALKNSVALMLGMLEGAGYSDNAKALVLTQSIQEIAQFLELLGGKKETIFAYCGIGDLILTAYGKESRNRALGIMLGTSPSGNIDEILRGMSAVPESINTIQSVYQFIRERNISAPLFTTLYKVVFEKLRMDALFEIDNIRSS